jgi:PST family polysaccharide transporter
LAAPYIAGFFNYQGLDSILRTLCLLFPIKGLAVVGESLAIRELRFRWLANRDALGVLIGYVIFGVGMALLGFGVWALVAASLVIGLFKTVVLLIEYPPGNCRPQMRAFKELIYFGGGQTVARVFNFMALEGDNLVVGRMLGLASLGLYGKAYQLMSIQATLFGQVLDDVLFPSMAKLQHEKKRLAAAYLRGVSLVALVMAPVSVVGFILAPELVYLILGPQWADAIVPFRILALGLLFRTSYKISDSLSRATGSVYRRAWRQGIYAGLVIGGAAIGQFWGVPGVAVGVLGALTVNFSLMAQLSLKIVDESWITFLNAHTNAFLLTAITSFITASTASLLRYNGLPDLVVVAASLLVLGSLLLLLMLRVPRMVIGKEGLWMLNILKGKYLPARLRGGETKKKNISKTDPAMTVHETAVETGTVG